ncbi:hypothetical protein ACLB2K_006938 [Fragaria x ananassa]
MDMWSRGEDPVIQPPQYSRQPGRPRTARMKAAYEKDNDGSIVIGKKKRALRCGSCKQIGHNSKTCHRHLPLKKKVIVAINKKNLNKEGQIDSNLTIILMQSSQKRKADMKAHSAPKRARPRQAASTQQSSRPFQAGFAPSISRNVQGSNASTKKAGVTPRTSQRIRQSSAKGAGK